MLSFHVVLGYHAGPPIPILLVIFVFRFLSSIRPTDPISGNAFEAKRKKRDGLGTYEQFFRVFLFRIIISLNNKKQNPNFS